MGPEIAQLEDELSAFGGMKHTLSCASGTDALALPLMAWGLRTGDAVFCPSFTFAATAEVVAWLGAVPYFVDVDQATMNMDPASLEAAIAECKREGRLKPKIVIAVDLFGQAADYAAIRAICDREGLKLISDAAQGYGATLGGEMSSRWADVVATSFFPAKPLGCYGDGGAVFDGPPVNAVEQRPLQRPGSPRRQVQRWRWSCPRRNLSVTFCSWCAKSGDDPCPRRGGGR